MAIALPPPPASLFVTRSQSSEKNKTPLAQSRVEWSRVEWSRVE